MPKRTAWRYAGTAVIGLLAAAASGEAFAGASLRPEAAPFCAAVARAVDGAGPGAGPVFVASYRPGPSESELPLPLRTSAFVYDDALAAIALVACGDTARATRIGDALLTAARHDRSFADGRLRNAYRAGPVGQEGPAIPGWWDAAARRWDEDAYQDGTATGNVAWAALALLTLDQATGRAEYRNVAAALLGWIGSHTADAPGPAGYAGGLSGFDGAQRALTWKSTEHNIDIAAAATWLDRLAPDPAIRAMAARAKNFVSSRFRTPPGMFLLGTTPDGADADPSHLALDVQLWPVLGVPDAPPAWRSAVGFADAHLRRGDGMTFAGIGTNRWTEGTAQAALTFRALGADSLADTFLAGLPAHASPSGLLYATSAGDVPTGLMVEADGGDAFTYAHRPHLGATAWAALAAQRWNPFTGRRLAGHA